MKGKFKLLGHIGLALFLVSALVLAMAPVAQAATAVGQPVVTVSPTTISLNAKYTIEFTVTTDLATTEYILIDFTSNSDTDIPVYTSFESGDVTVNGYMVASAKFEDPSDVVAVQFLTPIDLAAGSAVTVIFEKTADLQNPSTAGNKTLTVCTESDTTVTTSKEYVISGYMGKGVNLYNQYDEFIDSYETIQEAEDACSTFYTIRVEPGTYTENITINDATYITLESTGGKDVTFLKGEHFIYDAADNCTIGGAEGKGFTFLESTSYTELLNVQIDADNATISYNAFETLVGMTSSEAIFIQGTCDGLTVTENTFTLHNQYDMGIASVPGSTVTEFTLTNNTFTGCGNTVDHSGIELKKFSIESTDTTISGNTFTDFYCGLIIGASGGGMVSDSAPGVLTISDNTFDSCRYGLDIINATAAGTDQNIVVVGNNFTDCTYYGFDIDFGPCLVGTDYLEPSDFTVKFNNFSGNGLYGLYNNKNEAVDVSHNWWGSATGPSGTGSGSGDKISDYVTPYSPYLGASVSAADYTTSAATLHRQSTVGVDVTSSDSATAIGVAHYTANPQGTPEFTALDFFDVYATATTWTGDLVTIKLYNDGVTSSSVPYFWSDAENAWVECYDSGAAAGSYVWVKVREYSAVYPERVPVLTDLVDLVFAIGGEEVPPEFDPWTYDDDEDGAISKSEALVAVTDYFAGDITKAQALEVIALYFAS